MLHINSWLAQCRNRDRKKPEPFNFFDLACKPAGIGAKAG